MVGQAMSAYDVISWVALSFLTLSALGVSVIGLRHHPRVLYETLDALEVKIAKGCGVFFLAGIACFIIAQWLK